MSVKSSGYYVLRITIYEHCGTLLMELKCGKSDYIFNDVVFHDIGVMLQHRSLEGGLAGHLPSVPHSTPMYSRQSHYHSSADPGRSAVV